jgi:hypothetical protein
MMLANLLSGAAPASIGVIAPVAIGMPGAVALWLVTSTARSTRSYTLIAAATSGHVRSVSPSSRRR